MTAGPDVFDAIADRIDRMGEKGLRREVRRLTALFVSVEDVNENPRVADICAAALYKYTAGKLP